MKIARLFKFEAAHRLQHHDGRCRRLHGHSYRLEMVFEGEVHAPDPQNPQSGFIVDFGILDRIIRSELIDPFLDHHHLDDQLPELPYSSAEYLAAWIVAWCVKNLEQRPEMGPARIVTVRLWETVNAWAEADRRDATRLGFLEG